MKLAEGIRKHGFRKWYERELLAGHAHLVLVLFCALGVMMALEAATRFRTLADQLTDIAAVILCTVVGIWALRRYLYLLTHAEAIAHQADCPQCKTYGRLDAPSDSDTGGYVPVKCRKCGHGWRIEL